VFKEVKENVNLHIGNGEQKQQGTLGISTIGREKDVQGKVLRIVQENMLSSLVHGLRVHEVEVEDNMKKTEVRMH